MWFWFSLAALLCWSGSDLFSKIGCAGKDNEIDGFGHLKMVMAVGLVMGIHAAYEIFFCGVEITVQIILTYLPVSLLYISSMAIGYLGLRYIELSISSPICNSSGAVVAVLSIITHGLGEDIPKVSLVAVAFVCVGIAGLGITEAAEDEVLREARQREGNRKYAKSAIAIIIPIVYCLLDALGTFADSIVLESINEDSANVAYELTFLFAGSAAAFYTLCVKHQRLSAKQEVPKYIGAVFETAGQFFYIYALADTDHVAFAAPVISSYCVVSVLWGRVFLKEKLTLKHYLSVAAVVIGVVILGVLDI